MASTNTSPVKVVEVCSITPPHQSPESAIEEVSLPLTFFDIISLKSIPFEMNFFYSLAGLTPEEFHSVILPKLKHSLSLTLLHYLPLAGNLTWPPHSAKPIILYTPKDGLSLTVAESYNIDDFDRLSSNEAHDALLSQPYIPKLSVSDTIVSILALQITLFPNKGFSVAYTFHHSAIDGICFYMFLKAWSHISKHNTSSLPAELKPLFDRTLVQDPEGIGFEYLKNWSSRTQKLAGSDSNARSLKPIFSPQVSPSSVRATFSFSRQDIRRLRDRAVSQYGKEREPIHFSRFALLYAYSLVCMVKAKGLKKGEKLSILFPGDCRGRMDPPVPANYFGNCASIYFAILEVEPVIGDDGVAFVAEKISEMLQKLEKAPLEGAREKLANVVALGPLAKLRSGIGGSPGFVFYGIDFGWGRPKMVEFTNLDRTEYISMIEKKDESGGVEIGLVLKKHEMENFRTLFFQGLKGEKKISRL